MMDLRPLIRSILPLSIKRIISRFGHSCNIEIFLRDLKKIGIPIKSCIDVGAADGDFSKLFSSIFIDNKIFLIEPRPDKASILRKNKIFKNHKIFSELISEHEEQKKFAIKGNASSYYDVNHDDKIITLHSKRLENLINLADFKESIVKIDVQGAELDVLKSISSNIFASISAFIIEASTLPLWNNQADLFEIINFLDKNNFYLYSVGHMHRNSQAQVIQIDLCFINSKFNL